MLIYPKHGQPTVNINVNVNLHVSIGTVNVGTAPKDEIESKAQKGFWTRFKEFANLSENLSKLLKFFSALFLMVVPWLRSH